MIYLDSSVLAPLFKPEASSALADRFIRNLPDGVATISDWTRVEFASMLAKEVRIGSFSSAEAISIDQDFETTIQASFTTLTVSAADFDLAKVRLADHRSGLRAGDALHLAIAVNNAVQNFCSFDERLSRAARSAGLPTNVGLTMPAP